MITAGAASHRNSHRQPATPNSPFSSSKPVEIGAPTPIDTGIAADEAGDDAGAVERREPGREVEDHAGEEAGLGEPEQKAENEKADRSLHEGEASRNQAPADHDAGESSGARRPAPALTSPQFAVLALTFFLCCATHSGPLFHTVSYAISCGLSVTAAVSIYSVEGLSGLAGRIAFGLLGDRFGAKRTFVSGLLLQAVAVGCYFFARQQFQFYSVAVVFGFAYAGVMPLYAVLVRENFPLPIIGTVVGAATMASSLGMALGPLAGGVIFDRYGTYGWLYIGSVLLGLCHRDHAPG